ncbi:MAG: carbon-nitrogen hydrolase family protein, partial [Alphaproteobacteria bacterium]
AFLEKLFQAFDLKMPILAIAQIASTTVKEQNLAAAERMIRNAAAEGASMVAFPEFLMAFSPADETARELAARAEPVDGPFVDALREAARAANIGVLATLYEICPVPDRVFDTAVWIENSGRIASVYRKLHLYDAFGFKESDKFHPGSDPAVPHSAEGMLCGMMICYDLRFPEMARMLALDGAAVLFAPSGWVQGDMKLDHWQTMIKARALENGCYVVAPDQTGNIYIGHSLVADPMGRVVSDLGDGEKLQCVDLDPGLVAEAREKLPLLKNRREDVYAAHSRRRPTR